MHVPLEYVPPGTRSKSPQHLRVAAVGCENDDSSSRKLFSNGLDGIEPRAGI